jgi:two-component system, sensor histidine kinase and response regulator
MLDRMPRTSSDIPTAIARARIDLDKALARLQSLANDDRQRVSYSVHALNNYLMVVSTTLQLLRTKLVPKGDRDVKRWLDSLNQATNLMMSTARGVLTATSAEIPPLLFEPASVMEIAEGVCLAYAEVARSKRIRISWRTPSRRDHVLTDCVAVGAVLDNLLSNAVKFSEAGTTIRVTTSIQGNDVVCSIRDHGPGLSEADQAQLFQRGVRLSPKPTGGESSNGFGLAIARDLTRALGGRLSCTSVIGDGSCFTLALPLAMDDGFQHTRSVTAVLSDTDSVH